MFREAFGIIIIVLGIDDKTRRVYAFIQPQILSSERIPNETSIYRSPQQGHDYRNRFSNENEMKRQSFLSIFATTVSTMIMTIDYIDD